MLLRYFQQQQNKEEGGGVSSSSGSTRASTVTAGKLVLVLPSRFPCFPCYDSFAAPSPPRKGTARPEKIEALPG